jgi:hypothetical protein
MGTGLDVALGVEQPMPLHEVWMQRLKSRTHFCVLNRDPGSGNESVFPGRNQQGLVLAASGGVTRWSGHSFHTPRPATTATRQQVASS